MILTKEKIKSIDLDFLLSDAVGEGFLNKFLLMIPTNRRLRALKKQIISSSPSGTSEKINIETLTTFSEKMLGINRNFRQLSEAASTVLIKQSSGKVKLNYLNNYKGVIPFGTLDRIKNVISEYKRSGVTPELLLREAAKLDGVEKLKAEDVAAIYAEYLNKCSALNSFEIGDIYNELNKIGQEEFRKNFEKIYKEIDTVIFDGFDEFTGPEVNIIDSISEMPGTKIFLNFDYYTFNPLIFSHLDSCYDKLNQKKFLPVKDSSTKLMNGFTTIVREKLFKKKITHVYDFHEKIFKLTAPSREKEIELIAKEIKRLIIDEHAGPSSICVVFNLIDRYSAIIRNIFDSYGVPLNLTDRIPLSNSLVISTIINFLEILENDFYYKNIFRAFSSSFLEVEEIDVDNLMRCAVHLKIISGKDNWISILKDSIENLERREINNEDFDTAIRKENYKKAISDIERIASLLAGFEYKNTIDDFLKVLENLIVNYLKLPQKILNSQLDNAEQNVRALTIFFDTIKEVFTLTADERGKDEQFTLKFFLDQIRTACGWARFNVKEKTGFGVLVTTINEIRGLQFDHLFIGGLVDGDFPTRFNPEIFLSGSFAKQEMVHQTEQRYRFYQALCAWRKKLYLSLPAGDSGKELLESTFMKDFEKVFLISKVDEKNYDKKIYSAEEFLIRAGKSQPGDFIKKYAAYENEIALRFEEIYRAIRIDRLRTNPEQNHSVFSGSIFAESDVPVIQKGKEKLQKFIQSEFSISQLETYAMCPFKFFVERLLQIKGLEEPVEDIEPLELGALIHQILFKFYSALREKRIVLAGCTGKEAKDAEKILFKVAEEEFEKSPFRSPLAFYEKEKIFGINGNRKESLLYKFFEVEKAGTSSSVPSFFEVAFGKICKHETDLELSSAEPLNLDGIKLRGKIDRIEIDEIEKTFNVVDYKLGGKKPSVVELENGQSLQLPIYLLAAKSLLAKIGLEYSPLEMTIYSLKYQSEKFGRDNVNLTRKRNISTEELIEMNERIIDTAVSYIKNYIDAISKGEFQLSKLEDRETKICIYCEYKSVCRVKEISW
ncbi:MAG: PD-(D/E)XK nuclease family protein [bacterium]